eukprot:m.5212 g.5212  ORF g.5212 m.5212 type:complete len:358 (+) comp1982_c0_seq1:379-1452(+)
MTPQGRASLFIGSQPSHRTGQTHDGDREARERDAVGRQLRVRGRALAGPLVDGLHDAARRAGDGECQAVLLLVDKQQLAAAVAALERLGKEIAAEIRRGRGRDIDVPRLGFVEQELERPEARVANAGRPVDHRDGRILRRRNAPLRDGRAPSKLALAKNLDADGGGMAVHVRKVSRRRDPVHRRRNGRAGVVVVGQDDAHLVAAEHRARGQAVPQRGKRLHILEVCVGLHKEVLVCGDVLARRADRVVVEADNVQRDTGRVVARVHEVFHPGIVVRLLLERKTDEFRLGVHVPPDPSHNGVILQRVCRDVQAVAPLRLVEDLPVRQRRPWTAADLVAELVGHYTPCVPRQQARVVVS